MDAISLSIGYLAGLLTRTLVSLWHNRRRRRALQRIDGWKTDRQRQTADDAVE
jgi:hypothetical protein